MRDRPQDTPLNEWPPAWLRLECAALLKWDAYVLATEAEKRAQAAPVTFDEMRAFIRAAGTYT